MPATSRKAKTNWKLVLWPILVLWVMSAIYVFFSEFRSQAAVALPVLMVGTACLVFIANAALGSAEQARLNMEATYGEATACTACGKTDCRLEIVDYEYGVFLGVIVIQRSIAGKLCRECAVSAINKAFLTTVFGCILCPPLILFSWMKRNRMLQRYTAEKA